MDFYGFYTGQIFDAHRWLGAHYTKAATTFRTFAPQAHGVELVIDGNATPMNKVYNGQFYELEIADLPLGTKYEYRIRGNGGCVDHCDPYGYEMELRPNHKSIVSDKGDYSFTDDDWMKHRSDMKNRPLNIYELHAGSFNKPGDKPDDWYTYDCLADLLIPYLKENGYNYVEFLPLCEHPSDNSWGYQTTGYFAPTSRYGTPAQLKKLIDMLHKNGIGAILDFVPVHFAVDAYGLAKYDGSPLYEYPNNDVGMSEWGSCNFMHSRGEVKSFLQSSANFWLEEYHFDGLRMDAISRIIFWQGDERRGVNSNALDFVRNMNKNLKELNPGCMLIAEDSTSFKGITKDTDKGGVGFDYKWDLGWMNDTLSYFALPPEKRTENYHKLTFSMMYFGDENYLLPLSHDEVVHCKGTIVNKMYGSEEEKLAQARALYMYMAVHPGKKLNFMGNELAQLREWDEHRSLDFFLLDDPRHKGFNDYMKKLNHIYLENSAMNEEDYEDHGFEWADCNQEQRLIYAIIRRSKKEKVLAVFNFGSNRQDGYRVRADGAKGAKLLLCSDSTGFGGTTENTSALYSFDGELNVSLPPYSAMLFSLE